MFVLCNVEKCQLFIFSPLLFKNTPSRKKFLTKAYLHYFLHVMNVDTGQHFMK